MGQRTASLILLPAGFLYMALMDMRAALYHSGLRRRHRLASPTVSVGNVTFGGTGKTPFTVYLALRAREMGFTPAVLTRGYGREGSEPLVVAADTPPGKAGDEAVLMARNLDGIPVIAAARRERGAELAPEGTDLFVMDDGFKHLRVHRDADIVLVDPSRSDELRTPPLGRLREPLSALRRADLLALTRGGLETLPRSVALHWAGRPRIAVDFEWEDRVHPGPSGGWERLAGTPLVAFAGIAHPESLFDQARETGLDLRKSIPFPDHATPTEARLSLLTDAVKETDAGAVLCTEKDAVKREAVWDLEVPLVHPRLRARVTDPSGALESLLLSVKRTGEH
jgi:tetraacyldisaccharide 4'-kinase